MKKALYQIFWLRERARKLRTTQVAKNWHIRFLLIAFLYVLCSMFYAAPQVSSGNYESERYRIQQGTINIGGENAGGSENYNLSVSLGQTAAAKFRSEGFIVRAGFQSIHSIIPFKFSISDTSIDFGNLTPNTPATAETTLTVSFGGAGQYQVTAAEQNPLETLAGTTIPDTQCDGGGSRCTERFARPWTSNNAYGFGYNMNGDDISSDFINNSYFRPFPDQSTLEDPVVIMSNPNVGKNRQAKMLFKTNISAIQEAGSYKTVVRLFATPSY